MSVIDNTNKLESKNSLKNNHNNEIQDHSDDKNGWAKEEQRYKNLLEDMDEWAKEDWSEEEQEAFERAMSNLS